MLTPLARYGLIIAAAIVVADLTTKAAATAMLDYGEANVVLPFFNLTLLHNTGAAFSFLSEGSGWQRWLFITLAVVISGVLVVWLTRLKQHETWLGVALAFVLGGAVGNLYDRVVHGYVVDFFHFHWAGYHFPAFNVADSFITVGALMLLLDVFMSGEHRDSDTLDKGNKQ
ncbi:signal peptidase II [Salicola sp. Rm-C-2C1-2]|uniref:signal peptidase II n=1 Tax=Salicola sp. Rm-C-2C1-2 TaxID=3141321 RepID=UPI0032E4C4E3